MVQNRLKELRQEKRLTLRDLAEKIGIDHTAISRIENGGRNLSDDDIVKICQFFECSADYLLCLSDVRTIAVLPAVAAPKLDQYQLALYNASKPLSKDEKTQILDFVNYIKNKKPSGDGK